MQTMSQIVAEFTDKLTQAAKAEVRELVVAALGGMNGHRPAKEVRKNIFDEVPANGTAEIDYNVGKPAKKAKKAKKAKRVATPAQQKARKLQGSYMGGLRALSKKNQEQVKALRVKSGVEAAVKLAVKLKNGKKA